MQAFGDSFDLYAVSSDAVAGYWDSGTPANFTLVAGRFAGSRAMQMTASSQANYLTKSSGQNDAVHHFVFAWQPTSVSPS